jgi:hypothetical protein
MSNIRLVCLHFDGPIMVHDERPGFFYPMVIEMLNGLTKRGIAWRANSDRDMKSQKLRAGLNSGNLS